MDSIRDERVSKLVREFVGELADYIADGEREPEREIMVNRFLATVAGSTGVGLSLRGKHDALAATMLAVAVRLWTRKPEAKTYKT